MFDPVSEDLFGSDLKNPTRIEHIIMNGHGSDLYGIMYRARGKGAHPTAVILHGFPGHERNFDIGQVLCRAGWNSLIFHYRGSWGSEGIFSFHNVLEDVGTALSFLRDRRKARRLGVDAGRIVLLGHSMGAWAALLTGLADERVEEIGAIAPFNFSALGDLGRDRLTKKLIERDLIEMIRPLKGITVDDVFDQIWGAGDDFDISLRCSDLKGKRVLLVGAERDTVSIPEIHHIPIEDALKGNDQVDLTDVMIGSDHSFTDRRIALSRAVLEWLEDR